MKTTAFALGSLIVLAGCAGQGAQHHKLSQEEQGLVFSVPDASYTLTPECTKNAEVDHDEEARPMLVLSMKQSPECSEKAFETIFSKTGQRLTIEYGDQVLVESDLIVTPLDPSSPTRLGMESDELAHEISNSLK